MRPAIKPLCFIVILGLLISCQPGPVHLGSEPVAVKDSQGNVRYVKYQIHQTRNVTVPRNASGSDLTTAKIRAEFAQDPVLRSYNINVQTYRGEVTLTGKVPDQATRNHAIKMARYTKGVLMVHDHLVVINK